MSRRYQYFILFILSASLIPYLLVCFAALPFADDFCFGWTAAQKIPFLQKFLNQYLLWNGRYSADIFANVHPIITGKLIAYRGALCVSLLATPFVLYLLVKPFIQQKTTAAILALLITNWYLGKQPNLTEGIYWYIGIVNYHIGNLCFLLCMALMIRATQSNTYKNVWLCISILLLIISIGFNEIGAALIPIYCFTGAITGYIQKRNYKLFEIFFAVAFFASLFVFLSPGNFVRRNYFPHRFDVLYSAYYSLLQTFRFTAQWCLSFHFAAISFFAISIAPAIKADWLKQTNWKIIVALLYITIFCGSFLPYFATGILGQHRTINYVFLFAIPLWVWLLIAFSHQFQVEDYITQFTKKFAPIIAACLLVTPLTGNGVVLANDIIQFNFVFYEMGFEMRQKSLLAEPNQPVPPIGQIPESFKIVDAKADRDYWVDKCIANFYRETKLELK